MEEAHNVTKLGPLCLRLHDDDGAGHSLRYTRNGDCVTCARGRENERRTAEVPVVLSSEKTICESCGNVFTYERTVARKWFRRFCSRSCAGKNRPKIRKPAPLITEKCCKDCKETKAVEEFYKDPKTGGFRSRCKMCHYVYSEEHKKPVRAEQKAEWSFRRTLRKYGITRQEYYDILARQGGKCPICGDMLIIGRRAHIDHCHESGEIRSILCSSCNVGLGMLKDDPKIMIRAAEYVEFHQAQIHPFKGSS